MIYPKSKLTAAIAAALASTLSISSAFSADSYLKYSKVVDLSQYKGSTYLSLMKSQIKPGLDQFATQGFKIVDGATAVAALAMVDPKVSSKAIKGAGSQDQLKALADQLAAGPVQTLYSLPAAIAQTGIGNDRFGLTTYLSLVSGGGVAVKINDSNYAYNVNYGTGKVAKDEMTGRSYGESQPGHKAGDASDKEYLKNLEAYVRGAGPATKDFYRSILEILSNNDSSGFSSISPEGQGSAADFLSVYTAEQDRHMMANFKSHAWDEALLEVTLLSAYHAGQQVVKVMFNNFLTAQTLKQAPGGEPRTQKQAASMIDYWQFSNNPDPASKNRSGINVTRTQFRALGKAISDFERAQNPDLVKQVESHFVNMPAGGNVFAELSAFLINPKTAEQLNDPTFASDIADFLDQVRQDAEAITKQIETTQGPITSN